MGERKKEPFEKSDSPNIRGPQPNKTSDTEPSGTEKPEKPIYQGTITPEKKG
jgi:hypothetical protein